MSDDALFHLSGKLIEALLAFREDVAPDRNGASYVERVAASPVVPPPPPPSFEERFPQPARPAIDPNVYGTLTEAPLSRAYFARVLTESGFDPQTGFVKWGLEPFDQMPAGAKQVKLEAIQQAGRENARGQWNAMPDSTMPAAVQYGDTRGDPENVNICPKCSKPGKQLTGPRGNFYICTDPECRMRTNSGIKHTAWDSTNYARRVSEFRAERR